MANVNIKFNNKDYLLSCDDGQEESLKKLTKFLDQKYSELKDKLGNIGENKLLLITTIQLIDEYFDLKRKVTNQKNKLDEISIPYGIVTNKPFDYAEPLINYFDELKNCRELVCPDHLQNSKPSPEGILLACKKIGVDPKESVYIGDHPNDLIAGKNAGTKTIGCLYGYSLDKDGIYPESILVNKADEIINALKLL